MNLYVFFAIALGALTGVTNTAVLAPAPALRLSAERRGRRAEARKATLVAPRASRARAPQFPGDLRGARRASAPLAGAATPRAPAANR